MKKESLEKLEDIAIYITQAVGSVWSLIIHTIIFITSFGLILFGIKIEFVLLVLTTILSLEAIYLSIFIQLSVNHQAKALAGVEKDINEIQEDVEEIQESHEEIQEDIEEIQKDVEEIQESQEDEVEIITEK